MKYCITKDDWQKLSDWASIFAKDIKQDLPVDWDISIDEIQSCIFDTYISLAKIYREGDLSFTSYCYRYAKNYTLRDLYREYKRLKSNDIDYDIVDLRAPDTPISTKIFCNELLEKMDKTDNQIAILIMQGYSYREISEELDIHQMEITRRMRKYRKNK